MKPYPEYKDSGVEWIGKIPQNWILSKYKYFYQSSMGQTILKEDLVDDGDTPVFSATENEVIFGYINNPNVVLEKGDIVIPARGNSIGHVKLVKNRSTCTQTTIYSKKSDSTRCLDNYVFYYLKGLKDFLFQFDRTAIPQITVSQVSENFLTLPPFSEQKAIADFLDKKTALIDGLIEKKKRQIELLKEQRQAVINQAVTKGLNPNVEMKDSGIEWLGEIPKHWELWKFNHFAPIITCGLAATPQYVDAGIPFLSAQNVKDNKLILENYNYVSEELHQQLTKHRKPQKGDILLTRVGAGIGDACIIDTDLEFSIYVSLTHIRVDSEIAHNEFIVYFFSTEYCKLLHEFGTVVGGGVGNLNVRNLERYQIPLPSIEEQREIIKYLEKELNEIKLTITKAEKQIELLQEYRTTLISEAVTGKIDVRDYITKEVLNAKC